MDINLSCLKMFPVKDCTHFIRQIHEDFSEKW